MKTHLLLATLLAPLAGCMVGPMPHCGGTVSGDLAEHWRTEWLGHPSTDLCDDCGPQPYAAPPLAPPSDSAACPQEACPTVPACPECPANVGCPFIPPKQLLSCQADCGPPGRFFPVPVRPVFSPTQYGMPPVMAGPGG